MTTTERLDRLERKHEALEQEHRSLAKQFYDFVSKAWGKFTDLEKTIEERIYDQIDVLIKRVGEERDKREAFQDEVKDMRQEVKDLRDQVAALPWKILLPIIGALLTLFGGMVFLFVQIVQKILYDALQWGVG